MEVFIIKALQFILSITILVALHEGGHFFFAKLFKTRVSRFYVFANYKFHLWSSYDNWWRRLIGKPLVTERGEDGNKLYNEEAGTEYGLGWLPIGGYCQIDGMVDETQSAADLAKKPAQPWEFRSKKAYQRLLMMAGGVMVNFVLALFIYSMVLYTWGDSYVATKDMTYGMKFNDDAKALGFKDGDILLSTELGDFKDFNADLYRDIAKAHTCNIIRSGKAMTLTLPGDLDLLSMMKSTPSFVRPLIPADIDSVMKGSPAETIGMKAGDRIIALGGKNIDSWNEINNEIGRLKDGLADAKTTKDSLDLRTMDIVFKHKGSTTADTANIVLTKDMTFGVMMSNVANIYKVTHKQYGFLESFPAGTMYGINVLGGYVNDLKYIFSSEGAKSLGGFGTIGSLFPASWDWHAFWLMTAFLSIILAFMNIIPIPGLDGGHILMLLIEVITGRTPSLKFQGIAQNIGMALLLLLMVVANLNDILRWIGLM